MDMMSKEFRQLCRAANEGDAGACCRVGMIFDENGEEQEAERYLTCAVDRGHGEAHVRLAELYYRRAKGRRMLREGQEDFRWAVALLEKVRGRSPEALERLVEYYSDTDVPVDKSREEAVENCRIEIAERGDGEAKLALARRYKYGDGVPRSFGRAMNWLGRATEAGLEDARDRYFAEENRLKRAEEGDVEEILSFAKEAKLAKNYAESLKWHGRAAELGSSMGQAGIGWHYYTGYGVERDYAAAAEWYRLSAEQGFAGGQRVYGMCLWDGKGVPRDRALAMEWFLKSAEQGDGYSCYYLGLAYDEGEVVERDYTEAAGWFHLAEERNHYSYAQLMLARYYANGWGVDREEDIALMWCRKAAEQGNKDAKLLLGDFCYQGVGMEPDYARAVQNWCEGITVSPEELYDVRTVERRRLLEKAAQKNPEVFLKLGMCWQGGYGLDKDEETSQRCLDLAGEFGDAEIWYQLGMFLSEPDSGRVGGTKWLEKVAGQGHKEATRALGELHYGLQNWGQAAKWLEKAECCGFEDVNEKLIRCCRELLQRERSKKNSLVWLEKLVARVDDEARKELLDRYEQERDWDKLIVLCRKMAEEGQVSAEYKLAKLYVQNGERNQAILIYRKRAEAGDKYAAAKLADLYVEGREWDSAVDIYRELAENGDQCAAAKLADILFNARCGLWDFAAAKRYYELAGQTEKADMFYWDILMNEDVDLKEREYTVANGWLERKETGKAWEWFCRAGGRGHWRSCRMAEELWFTCPELLEPTAVSWIKKNTMWDADSMYMMACCRYDGWAVEWNRTDALRWLDKAAQKKHKQAGEDLAWCRQDRYWDRRPANPSYRKRRDLTHNWNLAWAGSVKDWRILAEAYAVSRPMAARMCLRKAAELGDRESAKDLKNFSGKFAPSSRAGKTTASGTSYPKAAHAAKKKKGLLDKLMGK